MVIGDYTVDQVIEKAQTLIEAMPYIKKFQGKTVVVKYGGSAMLDENLKYNVIKDVAMLKLVGMKPVIVHGGGKEISKWVEKVGKEAEFINGLRVTDAGDDGDRRDGSRQGQQESCKSHAEDRT